MSRFLLITPDKDFAHRVRLATNPMRGMLAHFEADYLPQSPEEILGEQGSQQYSQKGGEPPEVLIFGPGLPLDETLKFAAAMDLQCPDIALLLVATEQDELSLQAMRSGIRDILTPGADTETIRATVERAALAAAGRRRGLAPSAGEGPNADGGRVIAVMSPKGGVGKTTIATNLAVGLGGIAPMSVVIVDLDLQFGDVASGLLIDPEYTITDAVAGAGSQDSMVLKTYLSLHPSNIYALCAPRNPIEMDNITAAHITHLLKQLRQEFQYVVVDTAPGLGEHVLATLEEATDAVWVCGMDIPSVRGLRTGFNVLAELDLLPEERHVVLNMADRKSGISIQDIEATIGSPVDVVIPRTRTMPFATNKGVPVLQEGRRDPAAKALRQLVERFKPNWEARPHKRLHRRAVMQ
ncbi:AAA family ATPase [Pseudarthrobacter sp. J1738]|uniref:AAA family ATPase n=1 Tax=Pseudarthrobacter sp. J1738 TaxID=3420446 RepID=UPI003D26C102